MAAPTFHQSRRRVSFAAIFAAAALVGGVGLTAWGTLQATRSQAAADQAAQQARSEARLFLDWVDVDAADAHFHSLTLRRARLVDLGRARRLQSLGLLLTLTGALAALAVWMAAKIRREVVRIDDLPALTSMRQVRAHRARARQLDRPRPGTGPLHHTLPGTH